MPVLLVFQPILGTVERLLDQTYGNRYRCRLTLKDGTELEMISMVEAELAEGTRHHLPSSPALSPPCKRILPVVREGLEEIAHHRAV